MVWSDHDGSTPGSRYECKYLVDAGLVRCVKEFIRPFVRIDRFAAARGLSRYTVCSLYLDTPGLDLFEQSQHAIKNRYKLRVRCYSDSPGDPLFFEVKRRIDGVVLKRRCGLSRDRGTLVLERGLCADPQAGPASAPALEEFVTLAAATGCRPVLRVRYVREAYESLGDDPVRVTFDTDLVYAVTPAPDVSLNGAGWRHAPMRETILEVKFTERFPSWVADLVRAFDLQRTSVPKYGISMAQALAQGGRRRLPAAHHPWP